MSEAGAIYAHDGHVLRLERHLSEKWQREEIGLGVHRCPLAESHLAWPPMLKPTPFVFSQPPDAP